MPTVITLANLHGSLTVIAGPFAVYNQIMENTTSSAYTYIRNGFIFKVSRMFFLYFSATFRPGSLSMKDQLPD